MTNQQSRPFGLMLLIGLSFGVGVWNLLGLQQLALALKIKSDPSFLPAGLDPGIYVGLQALPTWFIVFSIVTFVIKAALLFTAAYGYYTFRRIGRYAGSAYAIVSLVESGVALVALDYAFTLNTLVGALFAIFTLLAVNGPFKPLLTR